MKPLALLVMACTTCVGQVSSVPQGCPLKIAVAGTNVPFNNGEHIVVWFENQSGKTVSRAHFDLGLIDAANQRHASSRSYAVETPVKPFQAGLMMEPARDEALLFGNWKAVRGLNVRIRDVLFEDGTEWHSGDPTTCSWAFMNASYQHDMQVWNADLRSNWNRRHPDDPMPEPALAGWLLPAMEGWR